MRRSTNEKIHLPFQSDKNSSQFDNEPITLLSNEEKIQELTYIIKEQENEINVMNLLLDKKNNNKDMRKLYNEAELIIEMSKLEQKNLSLQQEKEKMFVNINQKSKYLLDSNFRCVIQSKMSRKRRNRQRI